MITESRAIEGRGNAYAGIEYFGVAGASKECQEAVMRLVQFGDRIIHVRILTRASHGTSNRHCLLLAYNVGDLIAIRSGFSSGYQGEGPRSFSYVLQLLDSHGSDIEEYEVAEDLIDRINKGAVRISDLEALDSTRPIRPMRWHDYIDERDYSRAEKGELWRDFPPVIPLAIIDSRIMDLALSFWENPDDKLLKGYRRLEDFIRERAGIDEIGTKLFSRALGGTQPKLYWRSMSDGERNGRVNLFTGAYMAHRNPRAHRELKVDIDQKFSEFLLLNHLYRLEKETDLQS